MILALRSSQTVALPHKTAHVTAILRETSAELNFIDAERPRQKRCSQRAEENSANQLHIACQTTPNSQINASQIP